jgi:hypothetical protein
MRGPSSYARSLHRDLRLAAALIGEGTEVDTQRVRQIISHLTWLIRNHFAVCKKWLTWLSTYLVGGAAIWSSLFLGCISLWGTLSSWWLYGATLFWTLVWVCTFVKPVFPRIQTYLALPSRLWWGTPRPGPFIQVLGELGAPAIASLIQALGSSDGEVREAAARALGELGDPRAVAPFIQALGSSD